MQANANKKSGFSLIEVLITVAIMGILLSIALPSYQHYQQQAEKTQAKITLRKIDSLLAQYALTHADYLAVSLAALGIQPHATPNYHISLSQIKPHYVQMQATNNKRSTACDTLTLDTLGRTEPTQCWT